MKKIMLVSFSLISNVAFAAQTCVAWDYARLKDSTEQELIEHACQSWKNQNANFKEQYAIAANFNSDLREVDRVAQTNAVCLDQREVAQSVFEKKFGRKIGETDCKAVNIDVSRK